MHLNMQKVQRTMIEFKNINKSFFGNPALSDVCFQANSGEILALLGQNGAGKSTLMKILSGAYQKDSGQILIDNKEVEISNPLDAENRGIGIVYQELSGIPHLTVAENIIVGKDPVKGLFLDTEKQNKIASDMLQKLGADSIPVNKKLGKLSVSQQQICEIAKCMAGNPRIVVFDEPTTSLTNSERKDLFRIMKKMRDDGLTIIFITHYLEEAIEMCDRCVIMKDGKVAYHGDMQSLDEKQIVNYMIGQKMDHFYADYEVYDTGKTALEVQGLADSKMVSDADLKVNYGEVLGVSGLIGAGRTELAQLIFGARHRTKGKILLDGKEARIRCESDAVRQGIAYINEDRRIGGLNLAMPIKFNLSLPGLFLGKSEMTGKVFVKDRNLNDISRNLVSRLEIKCNSIQDVMVNLSGGNQQKVSIGKWIATGSKIFIFDEPTKGIDVLAKAKVYQEIRNLARSGCAVIVISSYNAELLGVCDRIAVMTKGKIIGEYDRNVSEETLMLAQAGIMAS